VVLLAGMAEGVVRSRFDGVSQSFFNWRSAEQISASARSYTTRALTYFAHDGKIRAIAEGARIVTERTFQAVRTGIENDPFAKLREFPYIGPITAFHLAKNLGFNTAKPDRHMNRPCAAAGFARVEDFLRLNCTVRRTTFAPLIPFCGASLRLIPTTSICFCRTSQPFLVAAPLLSERRAANFELRYGSIVKVQAWVGAFQLACTDQPKSSTVEGPFSTRQKIYATGSA
jgi:hypothetical protein